MPSWLARGRRVDKRSASTISSSRWMRFAYPPYAGTFFIYWGDETLNMIVKKLKALGPAESRELIEGASVRRELRSPGQERFSVRSVEDLPGNGLVCRMRPSILSIPLSRFRLIPGNEGMTDRAGWTEDHNPPFNHFTIH
uniref:Uncharacterized protein n=1 Tax=Candidatus Kentrum sp. LPFa TaxID=2126335 RepID=A0A450WRB3_9GAMM|nr:MAG: hypothetical protein BECKLPF1236B_GA0070989_11775 [Candidatus Kentron sp. LPFa]